MGFPKNFVIHSRRQTMLRQVGTVGRMPSRSCIALGHCSVTISQRHGHPSQSRWNEHLIISKQIASKSREERGDGYLLQSPLQWALPRPFLCKLLISQERKWRNWQTHQT